MGWTYVDYVCQQLNRMQTIRNELESVHRDTEVRSEPLTSNTPTQRELIQTNPSMSRNFRDFSAFNGLVKMSVTWSVVGTYSN